MKRVSAILVTILFLMTGCGGNKQSSDDFIMVDVAKKYPKKEFLLQDILDVEYIPLETNDEFVTQGSLLAVGKDIILVMNRIRDGNIYVFDKKTGKGLRKINKMGQGPGEYQNVLGVVLDEANGEMFVNSHFLREIFVYDLYGDFRRSFKQKEGTMYNNVYNFDRDNLIYQDGFYTNDGEATEQVLGVISKQDGSITKEIHFPFKEKKTMFMFGPESIASIRFLYSINPYRNNFILVEPSSDTMYVYSQNHQMTPFVVRTPSIQSMNTEVFLFPAIFTDRYYFMIAVEKVWDFKTSTGFPMTNLMYDKQEKAIFEYSIYNDDYVDKMPLDMRAKFVNGEIAYWQTLETFELVEAYEAGKLNGKLKEIAANLDEEDNAVLMLAKYKK